MYFSLEYSNTEEYRPEKAEETGTLIHLYCCIILIVLPHGEEFLFGLAKEKLNV